MIKASMTVFEKLFNNPDGGSRIQSPIVLATLGVIILIASFYNIATDSIKLRKSGTAAIIHFSEHPVIFVWAILFSFILAGLLLFEAYKRYQRNSD